MPNTRYYVLAERGGRQVELFKLVQRPSSSVISSPLLGDLVKTRNIHTTHHPPKRHHTTPIIHMSDGRGTDERIELNPEADPVSLPMTMIDLSTFDWDGARQFAKRSYAEKWVLNVERDGAYVNGHFYVGSPKAISQRMEAQLQSGMNMLIPMANGFRTAPGGHTIEWTSLVFDDEADITLGCLLLSCHPPEGDPGPAKLWTLGSMKFVAYGGEGEYTQGTTPG